MLNAALETAEGSSCNFEIPVLPDMSRLLDAAANISMVIEDAQCNAAIATYTVEDAHCG